FVARAVATGARLDACDERQAAQALINVCVSRLQSEARALGKSGPVIFPIEFDTLLGEFEPGTLRQSVTDADERLKKIGAGAKLVQRFLRGLIRLRPAEWEFDPVSASRASLHDLPRVGAADVDPIINELTAAGVLRVNPGRKPEADQVALRPVVLKLDWQPLHAAMESRSEFRTRAAEAVQQSPGGGLSQRWVVITDRLAAFGRW